MLAGCCSQQPAAESAQPAMTSAPAAAPAPAPAAAPMASSGTIGYFPSGRVEGSGLSIEKIAPAQVLAGQPYSYSYKVSNLTDATLENVVVSDRVTSDFTAANSTPQASGNSGGIATWNLGTFGPKEVKTIVVNGSSADEGVVTTCGWATYNPVICQDIHVVKANIELTKTEPSDETVCDVIPVTLTVKNSGSSPLTGVSIADTLPDGMTSDSKSSLTFDAGNLAPGESKDFKYNANVTAPGKFVNTAKVTTTEGVSADASATTMVHQSVLAVACNAQDKQYIGRKFNVGYTVSNTGDAPAASSVLTVPIPSGLTVDSTSNGGQVSGGNITWNLGTVDASTPQNVTATFIASAAGTYQFASTVKSSCGAPANSSCSTLVVGIPAILLEKSDNPDPVEIGATTTYTVRVTNQGNADDENVAISIVVDDQLVPVSSDNSGATIDGQKVTFPVIPVLPAKQVVEYHVVAKGVSAGNAHTKFILSSSNVTAPITAEESTTVY